MPVPFWLIPDRAGVRFPAGGARVGAVPHAGDIPGGVADAPADVADGVAGVPDNVTGVTGQIPLHTGAVGAVDLAVGAGGVVAVVKIVPAVVIAAADLAGGGGASPAVAAVLSAGVGVGVPWSWCCWSRFRRRSYCRCCWGFYLCCRLPASPREREPGPARERSFSLQYPPTSFFGGPIRALVLPGFLPSVRKWPDELVFFDRL